MYKNDRRTSTDIHFNVGSAVHQFKHVAYFDCHDQSIPHSGKMSFQLPRNLNNNQFFFLSRLLAVEFRALYDSLGWISSTAPSGKTAVRHAKFSNR